MPKSKEFIDSSDSDSNQESGAATTAQQSKSKSSDSSTKRQKTTDQSDGTVTSKAGPSGERLYEVEQNSLSSNILLTLSI